MKKIGLLASTNEWKKSLAKALRLENYHVYEFDSIQLAKQKNTVHVMDAFVFEAPLNTAGLGEFIQVLQRKNQNVYLLMLAEQVDLEATVLAYKWGVSDCIAMPFEFDAVLNSIKESQIKAEANRVKSTSENELFLYSKANSMQALYKAIARVSKSEVEVFLQGGIGAGKRTIAQLIYKYSVRKDKPCYHIDAGSLSQEVIALELFGQEQINEMGDIIVQQGILERANGATVILSSIENFPLEIQSRLLTVITQKYLYRNQGKKRLEVDVRMIFISAADILDCVIKQNFNQELYYHLSACSLMVPRLRQRKEDIAAIAQKLLSIACRQNQTSEKFFSVEAMDLLVEFDWPGNITQLKNICHCLSLSVNTS